MRVPRRVIPGMMIHRPHGELLPRGGVVSIILAVALLGGAPTAASAGAAAPSGGSVPGGAAPGAPYEINLYATGDFVPQATPYWCIGASIAMMLNVIGVTDDGSHAAQERYMRAARRDGQAGGASGRVESVPASALRGAGSGGWARALVTLGAGTYRERVIDSYGDAVRAAADALRRTNRPVGLIVWRGAHAWVMTGFTATADPMLDQGFRVTGVYIQDPWYPRVSKIWGAGKKPNTYLSFDALKAAFLPRNPGRRHADQAGKFVLVLPVNVTGWTRAARLAV